MVEMEMNNLLINAELDKDLRESEAVENQPLKKSKRFDSLEEDVESDEDTIYETMLDIQLRKDDSKAFFDNEIQGKLMKKSPRNRLRKQPLRVTKYRNKKEKTNPTGNPMTWFRESPRKTRFSSNTL